MKRRDFLKLVIGALATTAVPALAKENSISHDDLKNARDILNKQPVPPSPLNCKSELIYGEMTVTSIGNCMIGPGDIFNIGNERYECISVVKDSYSGYRIKYKPYSVKRLNKSSNVKSNAHRRVQNRWPAIKKRKIDYKRRRF